MWQNSHNGSAHRSVLQIALDSLDGRYSAQVFAKHNRRHTRARAVAKVTAIHEVAATVPSPYTRVHVDVLA